MTERAHSVLPLQTQGAKPVRKSKSVESGEVLDLAALFVEGAAQDGGMIAADAEARRLLDTHPDCQIPFEELRDTIARLAVARGVGVEFGSQPDKNFG